MLVIRAKNAHQIIKDTLAKLKELAVITALFLCLVVFFAVGIGYGLDVEAEAQENVTSEYLAIFDEVSE